MKYSDRQKREYMRMFFDGLPSDVCNKYLCIIPMSEHNRNLLKYRYVDGKSDKMIARYYDFSPLYINKQINKALVVAYDNLKALHINDLYRPK